MAAAKATQAQLQEPLRTTNIVGKDLYQLLTQPQGKEQVGPSIDALISALEAAVAAVKAAA